MTEAQIENKMVRMVRERGGLCLKFISPNNPGVPDRIVITPNGRTIFVELKTLIGRLSPIQRWQVEEMRKRGADVRVLHDWPAVKAFVEEVMPEWEDQNQVSTNSVPNAGNRCTGPQANG